MILFKWSTQYLFHICKDAHISKLSKLTKEVQNGRTFQINPREKAKNKKQNEKAQKKWMSSFTKDRGHHDHSE